MIRNILNTRFVVLHNVLPRLAALLCTVFGLSNHSAALPGQLDPTFGTDGVTVVRRSLERDWASSSLLQADGSLVIAGHCEPLGGSALCLTRLTKSGDLDLGFGAAGIVTTPIGTHAVSGRGLVEVANGRLLFSGTCQGFLSALDTFPDVCVVRYLANGALDSAFGNDGIAGVRIAGVWNSAVALSVQSDHKILVVGNCNGDTYPSQPRFCIIRLTQNGALDSSYGDGGRLQIFESITPAALLLDTNDRAIVAGVCPRDTDPMGGPIERICVARVKPDATLDQTFGVAGVTVLRASSYPRVASLELTPIGQVLVVNSCNTLGGPRFCIDGLTPNGAVDTSFGINGHVQIPAQAIAANIGYFYEVPSGSASILPDAMYVTGSCYLRTTGNWSNFCVKRLHGFAERDMAFGQDGSVALPIGSGSAASAVHVQSNGKVLISGNCAIPTYGDQDFCVARLKGGPYNPLTCALNLDANPTIDPATDALLITRYLLGYRGDALTTGAVGASPTRTNAEIETYLGTLMQAGKLDVDGDGQSLAMTDGLLLIRAMLGLAGTALTDGATNAAHPNVRNAQQILTWIESTHGVACLP